MAPPRRYNLNNSSRPSGSANSTGGTTTPSPAPASGNSSTTPSASSGGGSSGKNGVNIPAWIMPIGIAYLIIKGLLIIGRNYITIFDWVIIAILAFFAILSFWNGKNRWLSLVLIVAIGCIIWFNQAHIDSFKTQSTPRTEQSTGKEQVATAPVEGTPSTERVVVARREINLIGDGDHMIPVNFIDNNKYICFLNLGMKNGEARKSQFLTINGVEYSSLGEGCYKIRENLSGKFNVKFFPNPEFGNLSLYEYWRNQPGGQGILPYIAIE